VLAIDTASEYGTAMSEFWQLLGGLAVASRRDRMRRTRGYSRDFTVSGQGSRRQGREMVRFHVTSLRWRALDSFAHG
jgi:hypothetical protein